jgi:thiosulfate/3-mercaptopyruvate sulfurtransferase
MKRETKKMTLVLSIICVGMLVLSGCAPNVKQTSTNTPTGGSLNAKETASSSTSLFHPPSASTIATSSEAIAPFNVDELGASNIVDVTFIEAKIGDPNWVIIDGRSKEDYDKGHIPGAVNFGKTIVTTLKHPTDGRVIPPETAAELLGSIGVSNDKKLIVYGKAKDYHVTIEMYPLYLGILEWDYLDGGYEAWVKAGKTVETTPTKLTAAMFTPNIKNENIYISTEQLAEIVNNKDPKVTLIDNRSKEEYYGQAVDGIRGGRIPGAKLVVQSENQDADGFFLSKEKLEELYKDVPKDNTVIVYCHRGCRTGFSFLALRSLGYKDIRVYEDGFVVWGAQLDKPVDDEHFYNFRGTNSTINDLVNRVKTLEEQLKATQGS